MKKILFPVCLSIALLSTVSVSAQKKQKEQGKKPVVKEIISESDSISYAFGANLVAQGLTQYMEQAGIFTDTARFTADFKKSIEAEANSAKKGAMQSLFKFKLDSINAANKKNTELFIGGFKEAMGNSQKSAYYVGTAIATQSEGMIKNFSNQMYGSDNKLNNDAFVEGFVAALNKQDLLIKDPQALIMGKAEVVQKVKEAEKAEELKSTYATEIAEGEKFLEENKTKPGVITLPSGLQYRVDIATSGEKPKSGDRVKAHYRGTLLDGTVFDSSYDRGEPLSLTVGQLIQGWNEALPLMPVGSKWTLYIPYNLAYGANGQGQIKPFSTLIFEIELREIEK